MKMRMLPLLAGLYLLPGCGTIQPGFSPEDANAIRIECKKEKLLQMAIVRRLKSAGARDITVDDAGDEIEIVATFRVADFPLNTVYDIGDDLKQLDGVINLVVDKRPTVIRQSGFH
jgi:hypothetical protein